MSIWAIFQRKWENILADRKQLFGDLLRYVEGCDANRPISIFIEGASFDFEAQDLKDILLIALFEGPALRKSLDAANKDIETLQEQKAGETLTFEPPKWEYSTVYLSSYQEPHDGRLNKLGAVGWELIALTNSVAYFKRAL